MDVTKFTPQQMSSLRKVFHSMNRFMVFLWKIGLGKALNIWPAGFGRIMVIKHRDRKSGRKLDDISKEYRLLHFIMP